MAEAAGESLSFRRLLLRHGDAVPLAMAEAFRSGNLGVMDYQRYRNVQADTSMRQAIAGQSDEAPSTGA